MIHVRRTRTPRPTTTTRTTATRTAAVVATALAIVATGLLAGLGAAPASAAARTVVTGRPSTTTPAAGFQVPIRGTVTPARKRTIELRALVNGRWVPVARKKSRPNGQFTIWLEVPAKPYAYRVFAPATKSASKDRSPKFTMQATTTDRTGVVSRRSCKVVGDRLWDLTFRLRLTTGERMPDPLTMRSGPLPYVGGLVNQDGTYVDVNKDFSDVCP